MSEHLTALDATFLELEQSDDGAHMHIGGAMVFEALPSGGAPTLAEVREHLLARLGMLPRYRQRLSQPRTGGLTWPTWEPDEEFDIANHVREAALPAPGGDPELLDWLGDFYSHRLDRRHPLWETVLLRGLAHGRWAMVTKTHHCMVDGVGSVEAAHLLLDVEPEPHDGRLVAEAPEPAEDDLAHRLGFPLSLVVEGARAGLETVRHPGRLLELVERARATAELIVRDEVASSPRTSLNVPIGGHRRMAAVRVSLEDVRTIRAAHGGTVNDAVLTACTVGLRRLLEQRGEEPPEPGLRAMVPMNIRDAADQLTLGNRVWSIFAVLPVAEPDVLRCHRRMVEETQALKAGRMARGSGTLLDLTALAPPVLHATLARSLFATRLFNVTITNVPGPRQTLYAFGAPMVEVIPLVPLAAEHAVGVAIFSYGGNLVFGLSADRESVPDLDVMADGIAEAFDVLLAGTREEVPR